MALRHNVSIMRQPSFVREFDPKRGVSITTLAYEYPAEFRVPEHAHGADQLIYGICGVMEVVSGSSMWLVPPTFAIWVPAETPHQIHMPRPVSMRTLYFQPGLVHTPPLGSAVLHVTPLLRELILETVRIGASRRPQPRASPSRFISLAFGVRIFGADFRSASHR